MEQVVKIAEVKGHHLPTELEVVVLVNQVEMDLSGKVLRRLQSIICIWITLYIMMEPKNSHFKFLQDKIKVKPKMRNLFKLWAIKNLRCQEHLKMKKVMK